MLPAPMLHHRTAPAVAFLWFSLFFATHSTAAEDRKDSATLITAAGQVDAATAAAPAAWIPAEVDQALQVGDRLRTGQRSRASLRLSNLSVLRVNELTTVAIQPPPEPGQEASVLDLRSGAVYFFNRERPTTRFNTPTAAGAIRGTEFHLAVAEDGRTVLTLLEGEVELTNELGNLVLTGGEQGTVEPGEAPRKTAAIDALNIIQWTLYYPGVLDPDELELDDAAREALAESLRAYRAGDLLGALAAHPGDPAPASEARRVYYAAVLLAVGNVEEAERQLANLTGEASRAAALADALRETIAAVKNQPRDRTAPRKLSTEWMAGSYAAQSRGDLDEALAMARAASAQSPDFGFAAARVAELEFSFGRIRPALRALERSLALSPRNAQAVSLKGFLLAAENRHREAFDRFNEAIALDGALGNAWLGRGLIRIRRGEAEAGREDIQTAAALEPNRSALRSYLGKAFDHVSDDRRARYELDLARELDPNDPTPWLYSALLNHRDNHVNRAVRDLEQSQELNDNRQVYRSGMLLDQDRAVRSANLAAIYRDAGMTDFSAREASRAVHQDYANHSAHLFLANSYDALRDPTLVNLRYETPWLSEWLIANLLAPPGAGTLSQNISQQEYSRLFEGDRFGLLSYTEYRSGGDWLQRTSQYGVLGNTSYSIDGNYRSQNGDRPNQDFENRFLSAQFKHQITPRDGIFLQAMYQEQEGGDLLQYYDPASANPTLRTRERHEPNLFAGYHRQWHPGSHTLILGGLLDNTFSLTDSQAGIFTINRDEEGNVTGFPLRRFEHDFHSEFTGYSLEAQQIQQHNDHTFLLGSRVQSGAVESESFTVRNPPTAFPPIYGPAGTRASDQQVEADLERATVYGYSLWQLLDPLHVTAGVSYDRVRFPENTDLSPLTGAERVKEQVSPKAGIICTPLPDTVVRGAYTRSIGGLFYDTSVRLEPAQVAGFTQAYRSMIPESVGGVIAGSEFTVYGLGLDQKLPTNTYFLVEAELLESEAERTVGVFDFTANTTRAVPSGTRQDLDFRERSLLFSVNQLLGEEWAAGGRYRVSQAELHDRFAEIPEELSPFARRDLEAVLHRIDLFLAWQHSSGFFTQGEALWHSQSNRGYDPDIPGDDFWQFNAYAGYRFARRQGEVRIGILNIGDKDYRLNPLNLHAELPRNRTLLASLRLSF